jgi:hypothetical protein
VSKVQRIAAVCTIVIGLGMGGWWAMLLATGQMPELRTTPIQSAMHLGAEFLTALALLAGGVGLLTRRGWGLKIHLSSLGMLLYAVVQAAGYYAQHGDVAMIGMFAALALLAVGGIGLAVGTGNAPHLVRRT